jgi:hypothetical protein
MQALGAESPHPRPAKRSRSHEPLVELPTSPPLPLDEDHQLAATFDPDTLDCQICMEPLSSPIFQVLANVPMQLHAYSCTYAHTHPTAHAIKRTSAEMVDYCCCNWQCSNGHIACSSCCQKLSNLCASCSKPTGKIRCLAIEKLIESLHMGCRYAEFGCRKMLKFAKKRGHETACAYAPFQCPVAECAFCGAAESFPDHFSAAHQTRTLDFQYDAWFTVVLNPADLHVVLKAENMVFLLHHEKEPLGDVVYVTFFGAPHREEFFSFHLAAKSGQTRLTMESVPRSILQEEQRATNFVLIPRPLNAPEGLVQIELSFHHPGEAISGLQINP